VRGFEKIHSRLIGLCGLTFRELVILTGVGLEVFVRVWARDFEWTHGG